MRTHVLPVLAIAMLTGCSLMGLDEIELKRCVSDDDCAVFNTIDDLPASCHAYYCDDGACLRHAEGAEVCDGRDNDCDGLVDEPATDAGGEVRQTMVPQTEPLVDLAGGIGRLDFGIDAAGQAAAAWSDTGGTLSWYAPLSVGTAGEGEPMSYLRGRDEPDLRQLALTEGCFRRLADGSIVAGDCNLAEVAVALTSAHVFAAAVNTNGCAAGQLRLGSFPRGEDPAVILRGPGRRSNCYLGVDLNADGTCTGGSRPGCDDDVSACGVARPSLAAIDDDLVPQALAAWIGDRRARTECGGDEANVEAIAAFLPTGTFGTDFTWVTASDEGIPEVLGRTAGGGRPAVVAWERRGYFVGYGNEDGDLALHFVPAQPDPPDYDGYGCDGCAGEHDRSGLETGPLRDIVDLTPIEAGFGGPVDDVAIAVGQAAGGELRIGVAWREGCGAGAEVVAFRMLTLGVDGDDVTGIEDEGEAVRMSPASGPDELGPPAVVHLETGVVVEGFERGGAGPATEDDLGGWLVLWPEVGSGAGDRVVARRASVLDGLAVDDNELIVLGADLGDAPATARAPAAYPTADAPRFAFLNAEDEVVTGGTLICTPPDEAAP